LRDAQALKVVPALADHAAALSHRAICGSSRSLPGKQTQPALYAEAVAEAIDSEQLREIQDPLKRRYREDPSAALITLEAEGNLEEGIACSVNTGRALVAAGLHPGTGGDGSLACSGDMLLQALVACAGVTMRAVATSMGIAVTGTVHAEGDLDWRGTLAVDKEARVGFTEIRLRFNLESDVSESELSTLMRLTERYCVVFQTLANSPRLLVSREPS
jgi:uncharacterized OsmC-like protein